MMNQDIKYITDEMIKSELRNLDTTIFERAHIERWYYDHIQKLFIEKIEKENNGDRKNDLIRKMQSYQKRNYGKIRAALDYYDMRINAICNHLDKVENEDLDFIYDMLIYPIGIKELVKKYKVKDMNHCYRKLDRLISLIGGTKDERS